MINEIIYLIKCLFRPRTFGMARGKDWWRTKKDYEILHPKICPICRTKKKIELHHKIPFHKDPSKENDFDNLVWGCRECHHNFYHLKDWSSFNSDILEDIKIWHDKILQRPF